MAAAAILHFENVNISWLDEDISTKFGGKTHRSHMEMGAGTLITLLTTARWLSAYMYSIALVTSTTATYFYDNFVRCQLI